MGCSLSGGRGSDRDATIGLDRTFAVYSGVRGLPTICDWKASCVVPDDRMRQTNNVRRG